MGSFHLVLCSSMSQSVQPQEEIEERHRKNQDGLFSQVLERGGRARHTGPHRKGWERGLLRSWLVLGFPKKGEVGQGEHFELVSSNKFRCSLEILRVAPSGLVAGPVIQQREAEFWVSGREGEGMVQRRASSWAHQLF